MANFKNTKAKIADGSTDYATFYSAAGTTVVHAVYISNNSVGSNAEVTLEVMDDSDEVSIPLLDKVPLRANTTLVLEKPINLEASDWIRIKSSTGCPITAFGSIMEV